MRRYQEKSLPFIITRKVTAYSLDPVVHSPTPSSYKQTSYLFPCTQQAAVILCTSFVRSHDILRTVPTMKLPITKIKCSLLGSNISCACISAFSAKCQVSHSHNTKNNYTVIVRTKDLREVMKSRSKHRKKRSR